MIKIWLILERDWEYDDCFYGFVGAARVFGVFFARAEAFAAVDAAEAAFWRDVYGDDRYEHRGGAACRAPALRHRESPLVVQEIVVTQEFLHTAGLSDGQRQALLRGLADVVRPVSPRAADHLEAGDG